MLNFIWGVASIAFMVVILLVFLLAKIDVGDVVYAMLSGSVVGLVAGIFSLAKGVQTHRAVFLVFAGILAAAIGWLFGLFLLSATTITLYSNTALAFDLIVGVVGASTLCFFLVGLYVRNSK